jgi:recombination protein RecR
MQINSLNNLITFLAKLPGLGPKSAKRIALSLIQKKSDMLKFSQLLTLTAENIRMCQLCFNIDVNDPCHICANPKKDSNLLCVIENIADLWAIEKSQNYNGLYHVLGGALSAINRVQPDDLHLTNLKQRILEQKVEEVIIATNSTLEGQTTGHYIVKMLDDVDIKITRLASGIPIGAELDYVDNGTLALALKLRHNF